MSPVFFPIRMNYTAGVAAYFMQIDKTLDSSSSILQSKPMGKRVHTAYIPGTLQFFFSHIFDFQRA
jgi:hypothetical protein